MLDTRMLETDMSRLLGLVTALMGAVLLFERLLFDMFEVSMLAESEMQRDRHVGRRTLWVDCWGESGDDHEMFVKRLILVSVSNLALYTV